MHLVRYVTPFSGLTPRTILLSPLFFAFVASKRIIVSLLSPKQGAFMRPALPVLLAFCAVALTGCATAPAPCLSFGDQHRIYRAEASGVYDASARAAVLKKIGCEIPDPQARVSRLEGRPELVASDSIPQINSWFGNSQDAAAWAAGYAARHRSAEVSRALAQAFERNERPTATALYAMALNQGSVESAHDLAFAYLHGWDGQAKSPWAAYYWYHHGAMRGIPESLKACVALEETLYAATPAYVTPCKTIAAGGLK